MGGKKIHYHVLVVTLHAIERSQGYLFIRTAKEILDADYSQTTWIYLLKAKSDTLSASLRGNSGLNALYACS